ncbi:MAG: acetate uptake transporter [Bacteroidota bacterium]
MQEETIVKIADTGSNPAPLGLAAFGLTTILLNIHNAGFYGMDTMIFAMGIFYGGIAQVIAGIMEYKKKNTFGFTAFISYGFFWISLVALMVMPKLGWGDAPSKPSMASYLGVWCLFSTFMLIGTFKLSRALQVVFALLVILFILLITANLTGSECIHHAAGFEGIVCGLSALYTSMAQLINEVYGRTVLPIGAKK